MYKKITAWSSSLPLMCITFSAFWLRSWCVVLDCIYSWSLPPSLLSMKTIASWMVIVIYQRMIYISSSSHRCGFYCIRRKPNWPYQSVLKWTCPLCIPEQRQSILPYLDFTWAFPWTCWKAVRLTPTGRIYHMRIRQEEKEEISGFWENPEFQYLQWKPAHPVSKVSDISYHVYTRWAILCYYRSWFHVYEDLPTSLLGPDSTTFLLCKFWACPKFLQALHVLKDQTKSQDFVVRS